MGIKVSEGKIEASGKIGGRAAEGSIDDEGVIELGIDFKVGGLGITSDYGGAIKISIAGQSITWGREGGLIEYKFAGFEVTVEARNCVVTETKKIAGIVVAEHTYPDPGCKLPDPPDPPKPPFDPIKGVEMEDGSDLVYCVVEYSYFSIDRVFDWWGDLMYTETSSSKHSISVSGIPTIVLAPGGIPFEISDSFEIVRTQVATPGQQLSAGVTSKKITQKVSNGRIAKNTSVTYSNRLSVHYSTAFGYQWQIPAYETNGEPSGYNGLTGAATQVPQVIFGTKTNCNIWVRSGNRKSESYWSSTNNSCIIRQVIPLGKQSQPPPILFLPTGNKPPVNQDCCEEILDKLDDFEEILHINFFKKNKFPVPAYLLAPGCDPAATTEIKNYYGLFRALFQALAHGMIVSPKVAIQDTDSVKEGDQSLNSEYLSATGWAEAITKMLYEVVDDGNVATNMDIRTGVTVTQLLVAVANLSYKVDAIIDAIGVTTIKKKDTVETSFSLVNPNNKKGFDPKKDNQKIDLNDDRSTEEVLAGLLQTRNNPIVKEEIHPKSKSLVELLEALKNK